MEKFNFDYHKIQLLSVVQEIEGVYTFKFSHPGQAWEEGTHVHLAFEDFMDKDPKDKTFVRHLSIMNLDKEPFIGFTTRITKSPFKTRLLELKIGDAMILYKIKQRLPLRRENKNVILISMGVGLSTMKPLMESYSLDQKNVNAMVNINISKQEFVYHDLFKRLNHIDHHLVTSRQALYETLNLYLSKNSLYYIVGSDGFLKDLIHILLDRGIEGGHIEIDKKPNKRALLFNSKAL